MKIALVSTGGTIAMAQGTCQDTSSLSYTAEFFVRKLAVLHSDDIVVVNYSQLPSSHFDSGYSQNLADRLMKLQTEVQGIVITHGTDTMEETAFYLGLVLPNSVPVVLTGAMMAGTQPGYDGVVNLQNAYRVVREPNSANKGVLIVFNRDIMSSVHAAKVESERPCAFGSVQTGKLGAINGNEVLYYYETKPHIQLGNHPNGKVFLSKLHYDIEPSLVRYCCSQVDIVIFECFGGGRVPPKLLPIIDDVSRDRIVILTTRVLGGHLYDEYSYEGSYHYFLSRRVIFSPLNSLKSCLLARLCLGNGMTFNEMKKAFEGFFR